MRSIRILVTMVLGIVLALSPNPMAPTEGTQERDSREGRIVDPDSSGWGAYAKNHAKARCGLYFFHESEGLRFLFNRPDTTRRGGNGKAVTSLALAKTFTVEAVEENAPSAIELGGWKFEIRISEDDTVSASCLKQPPP